MVMSNGDGGSVTLSQAGDSLVVDGVGALGHQEIVFLSTDRAVSLGTGTEMVFRRDPDGRITAVESTGLVMARQR